jgi:hypothetical protein
VQTILKGRQLTASRGGTLLLGVIAAAIAAILLVVYLRSYRDSVNSTAAPATVLIAKRLIVKGTPGAVVAKRGVNDFTAETSTALNAQITGPERGISMSMDATKGALAHVATGDRVDIYLQRGSILKLFRPNVLVISAPGSGGGNVVLRVPSRDVANVLYASYNTTLYFVIRPASGATPTAATLATLDTVVARTSPR